jgi:hypothetical protein
MNNNDTREIKESLVRIHGRLDKISELVAATNARCPLHVEAVRAHDEILNADVTGLRPRVLSIEKSVGLMIWGVRAIWGVLVSLSLLFIGWAIDR